ncbi:TolC family protein [Rhodohalobacter sp.]|uniref:TolC family protein n=1 Tax=Rhodohalobacter sp. TaxID=1974210 RepID=UPI002ACD59BA|nr:TolC family protein [Rhodohalobacter sp.]MDZ7756406.1 TolC family protein [Rhodohalobacter sp.]
MRSETLKNSILVKLVFVCSLLLFTGLSNQTKAQVILELEDAVRIGLENNFSIRIVENQARISENNNSLGNAGFLPVISADGSVNERVQDNVTVYGNPNITDRNDEGAVTTVYDYGVNATWRIFDGLTMFATLDRLSSEMDISEAESQLQVENVLADIITGYYQIAGQQKAAEVLENTVEISEERIRIAETKRDLGSGSEYELLLARADYNTDRTALIRANTNLNQLKVILTSVLADSVTVEFSVQPEIELAERLVYQDLLNEALEQNQELKIARLNEQVAKAEIREIRGDWMPNVDVSGGYGYSRTEASSGFSEFSETKGWRYGVSASINLFDGFNKNRRMQNAQIRLKNQSLSKQDLQLRITAEISRIYAQYTDALDLIDLEQENLEINNETVSIALERFELGTINSLELREAQQSLLNAENRLIEAEIAAKSAETELLRLSGRLLQKSR